MGKGKIGTFRDDLIDRMKTGWVHFVLASSRRGEGMMVTAP
jgi:hypothetical protein